MCTISVVPFGDGVQVCCNRDEQRTRPRAVLPRPRAAGDRLALFPADPPAHGTWIGVNDRGLIVGLLNRTGPDDRPAVHSKRCTRGMVTRHALQAADLDHAVASVTALPLRAFDPFTVVIIQDGTIATVHNDGWTFGVSVEPLASPVCFTSSSLGDARVMEPRLELFDRLVASARQPLLMQGTFHRHRWPDRPELSVEMRRDDAATLSRTWITVAAGRITMAYQPLDGEGTDAPTIVEIACTSSLPSFSRRS